MAPIGFWLAFKTEWKNERKSQQNVIQISKINPEGTSGPIWSEVVVLEPWQSGHHASIKKRLNDKCMQHPKAGQNTQHQGVQEESNRLLKVWVKNLMVGGS